MYLAISTWWSSRGENAYHSPGTEVYPNSEVTPLTMILGICLWPFTGPEIYFLQTILSSPFPSSTTVIAEIEIFTK